MSAPPLSVALGVLIGGALGLGIEHVTSRQLVRSLLAFPGGWFAGTVTAVITGMFVLATGMEGSKDIRVFGSGIAGAGITLVLLVAAAAALHVALEYVLRALPILQPHRASILGAIGGLIGALSVALYRATPS